jgi:hypothetical protein
MGVSTSAADYQPPGTSWAAQRAAMLIILIILAGAIVALNIAAHRKNRDGAWHAHGIQMRRWADDRWQYRPMTDDEYVDEQASLVW